jgi:tetratricopeptide (TPR) repeat protein
MLDSVDIERDLTDNQDSYDNLVSTIEISQGSMVLLIASCQAGKFQDELIQQYETELAPAIPSYRVTLDRSEPSLRAALAELVEKQPQLQQPQAKAVISVTGAANLLSFRLGETEQNSALDRFYGYLQWTREGLREFSFPIVLWVTPQILSQLSVKAPDFWSWRGGVFRFMAPAFIGNNVDSISTIDSAFKTDRTSDLPIDELLEQIAQIEAQNPNSPTLATLFDRLGQAYMSRTSGDRTENRNRAIEYFQQALTIQTQPNLNRLNTLIRLANLYRSLSDWNNAESLYQECLNIETELGDRAGMATSWGLLGDIARNRGDYDQAEALYNQSLAVRTELGDRAGMATSWGCLGENELERGNLEAAETWLKQALPIFEEFQMPDGLAELNWDLARLYRAKGDEPQAQARYSISHGLYTKLGAKKDLERIESEWSLSG